MKKYFEKNSNIQLIHFTDSFVKIKSILEDSSLRLRYCKEEFCIPDKTISSRVHPMVCFSEQNIHQLKDKTITYGKYGIAFSPDWIIKNTIQPVIYIEKDSPIAESFSKLLVYRRKGTLEGKALRLPIMTLACFIKNTVGKNSHTGEEDFLFKEENEWRFVPTKKQIGGGYISQNRSYFNDHEKHCNEKLKPYPLTFEIPKDVEKVYCADDSDVPKLIKDFPELKGCIQKYTWKDT